MAVFRELTLKWGGREYTMTPSAAVLRRVKARGINNLRLAYECLNGGVDPAELCVAHSIFLREAGAEVSEDESYDFLMSENTDSVLDFTQAYVEAVMPSVDLGKKQEAQPASPAKARAKPKKKTSRT